MHPSVNKDLHSTLLCLLKDSSNSPLDFLHHWNSSFPSALNPPLELLFALQEGNGKSHLPSIVFTPLQVGFNFSTPPQMLNLEVIHIVQFHGQCSSLHLLDLSALSAKWSLSLIDKRFSLGSRTWHSIPFPIVSLATPLLSLPGYCHPQTSNARVSKGSDTLTWSIITTCL